MKIVLLILSFFSFAQSSVAQSVSVVSHYPESAYVTGRLLPFTLADTAGAKIVKVSIAGSSSCLGFVDPYYDEIFHIYCRTPEIIDVEVLLTDSFGKDVSLQLRRLSIASQRAPGDEFGTVNREDPFASSGSGQ